MGSILKNLVIAVIFIGLLYLAYTIFLAKDDSELVLDGGTNEGQMLASEFLIRLNELNEIDFSRELFEDARFRSFTSFSTAPDATEVGRPNPFSR